MRQPFPSEILDSDIRRVDTRAALDWLRAGWRDVRLAPVLSVTYGFVFTVLGWIIFNVTHELPWLFLSMVSGFLLVAPFLAIGTWHAYRALMGD